jgi:hypothetical protein
MLSKSEQKQRKIISSQSKKLPKNFASLILDLELKIDGGNCDIDTVNELMQLYSVSNIIFKHFNFSKPLNTIRG